MVSSIPCRLLAIAWCAAVAHAVEPDLLANRITMPGVPSSYGGTTVGMGVEAGEVNQSLHPTDGGDRSVWYEWNAPATSGSVEIEGLFLNATPVRALAAYTLFDPGQPVTMAQLRPAAACIDNGSGYPVIRLWTNPSEKFILRVWTSPTAGSPVDSDPGSAFYLRFTRSTSGKPGGDSPFSPVGIRGSYGEGGQEMICEYVRFAGQSDYTAETAENRIGLTWYPAAAAMWFEWQPRESGRVRFSLTGEHSAEAELLAVGVREVINLEKVAGPGTAVAFYAASNQKYLIRVAAKSRAVLDNFSTLTLTGANEQLGDEPSDAMPLAAGAPVTLNFPGASASPNPLPETWDPKGRPDIWLDLGNSLTGAFEVKAPAMSVRIYLADPAGNLLTYVAGGPWSDRVTFLAEPGNRYLARVESPYAACFPLRPRVTISEAPPQPPNDRREGAIVLPAGEPVLYFGNSAGATAEESDPDWPATAKERTVWYTLDRPADEQPWFVWAWNWRPLAVNVFRQQGDGSLLSVRLPEVACEDPNRFLLTGERVWICVRGDVNPHFVLMAGPAVSEGDQFADAIPITPGAVRFIYPGAAGTEPGEPAPITSPGYSGVNRTVWLSWTAGADGLVHFSTLGSASMKRTNIYTGTTLATLLPANASHFTAPSNSSEFYGGVESFQATAGTVYHFQVSGVGPWDPWAPIPVRIKPGGWTSPYDLWVQTFPSREADPALTDPNGDSDADGIVNLIEMAILDTKGPLVADDPGFPWPQVSGNFAALNWIERAYMLRGPEGCIPFQLTGEASENLITWAPVTTVAPPSATIRHNSYSLTPPPAGGPPGKYFRFRVTR